MNLEDAVIKRETRLEAVKNLWSKLSHRQVECLCLSLMGLTQQESGEVLGVTKQAVSHSLNEILEKLG